jgi:hypothetical protein
MATSEGSIDASLKELEFAAFVASETLVGIGGGGDIKT